MVFSGLGGSGKKKAISRWEKEEFLTLLLSSESVLLRRWGMWKCDGSQLRGLWLWKVSGNSALDAQPAGTRRVSLSLSLLEEVEMKCWGKYETAASTQLNSGKRAAASARHLLPFLPSFPSFLPHRKKKNLPCLRLRNAVVRHRACACEVAERLLIYFCVYFFFLLSCSKCGALPPESCFFSLICSLGSFMGKATQGHTETGFTLYTQFEIQLKLVIRIEWN